ncbi:MAG: Rrf2 family transcriptional regulator [Candidatus Marinimicrobia bacterium]|nr:Rrf2 family transcriptional regulator [Candidatus Neomarinimicrobiota bacterium]MBL7059501.1 Rrf2 family transcriptional regulator [Candidatus Neomarinimicrobiota bacterium]
MLKLTRKVEYALIALRHLQGKKRSQLSSTKEIAEAYHIPVELLAKTLQLMARNEIIDAVQGPLGGYRIKADFHEINMTDFIEMIEGPLGLTDCHFDTECVQANTCNIKKPINKVNKSIRAVFNNMTLADITG